mmetsp:Transcript_42263/g.112847  ORF Transcript_42263/g.112847 Transcript_42263/m.112847 type:complete len:325 (+) Transcript_42263:169-1143(+)
MVTIHIFERRFGLFVTLLQFGGYTFFAFLQWLSRETKHSSLPMSYCVSLAVLQASMQGLSNLSIKYLNYPAKVLFKSSRVIPTMLFGVVFYGKRYKLSEYGVMGVLVLGLVIFMGADATTSPDFDPIGVVLILASLMVDACIINLQEYMFNHFQSDEEEMIFMSYAGGSLVLLLICMATGEMSEGLAFIDQHGASRINIVIFIYAACGFCGVSCVAALTKRFGALTAALTTTARKVSARHTGAGPQAHRHHRQLCPLNPPPRPLCSLPAYHGTGDHDITLVFDLPEAVCVRARVRRGAIYLRPSGAVAATRGRRTKAASYHRAS